MDKLKQLYFKWLTDIICTDNQLEDYATLLSCLFDLEYVWIDEFDGNLSSNGLELRLDFLDESPLGRRYSDIYGKLDGPCSVLEMLIALSLLMEDRIMSNDTYGNRTSEWFWGMIENLGLDIYDENNYDEDEVCEIVDNFLNGRYEVGKKGGLFTLKMSKKSASFLNIWSQAMNYLTEIALKNGEIY